MGTAAGAVLTAPPAPSPSPCRGLLLLLLLLRRAVGGGGGRARAAAATAAAGRSARRFQRNERIHWAQLGDRHLRQERANRIRVELCDGTRGRGGQPRGPAVRCTCLQIAAAAWAWMLILIRMRETNFALCLTADYFL